MRNLIKDIEHVLVAEDKEQDYCQAHRFNFSRLKNGTTVMTAARELNDSVHASVNLTFPTGSWYDPWEKKGTHHLLEHLFNPPIKPIAVSNDCGINASTAPQKLIHVLRGPANIQHKDFGLWNLLPFVYKSVTDPLAHYNNINDRLVKEKQVVFNEIHTNQASHRWQVNVEILKWFFSLENPISDLPTGSEKNLHQIAVEDLEQVVNECIIPDGLIVSGIVENDQITAMELFKRLTTIWENFDRPGQRKYFNNQDYLRTNPNLDKDDLFVASTGLKNETSTLVFAWEYTHQPYSIEEYALESVVNQMRHDIFEVLRSNGWGYTYDVNLFTVNKTHGIIAIWIDLPKQSAQDISNLKMIILSEMREKLQPTAVQIAGIRDKMTKRFQVWPIEITTRFRWMLFGLHHFDRLIDVDAITKLRMEVTSNHIHAWYKFMCETDPYTAVIGDIKES